MHRATDEQSGESVLIKSVRPADLGPDGPAAAARLSEEADRLRAIRHAGIARIVADGWDDPTGARFLVLERIDGETLGTSLARTGAPDRADAKRIAEALCETLEEIHSHGLVHLGIDPAVLFLRDDRAPFPAVLADLSLMRSGDPAPDPGPLDGDLACMSPERVRGDRIDARSDVYAVGAILHLMLTGRVEEAKTTGLADVARRMLERDPERRPRDAREALELLRAIS